MKATSDRSTARPWPAGYDALLVCAAFAALYLAALYCRPLLPIDETRYLTVAWEMRLSGDWFGPLTMNFAPYHHKPPLLFWMINLSWAVFGVSRGAAMLPVVLAAMGSLLLGTALGGRLFPELRQRVLLVLLGSLPLVLYSTLILFDLSLTVLVLASLLALREFAASGNRRMIPVIGLCLGLGVLTKGPVTYLYVAFPVLFAPWWMEPRQSYREWYRGAGYAFLVSLLPVAAWLAAVLGSASSEFAYSLVWNQTAGRVNGSFAGAHARSFFFYIPILLVFGLPWLAFRRMWTRPGMLFEHVRSDRRMRFLVVCLLPAVLAFSLIRGKQPHYLVPLVPALAILIAWRLREVSLPVLRAVAAAMVAFFVLAQLLVPKPIVDAYDLRPVVDRVLAEHAGDIAFVGNYNGEITFLGRLRKPVDVIVAEDLTQWFADHPQGIAVAVFREPGSFADYRALRPESPYRGMLIGVYAAAGDHLAAPTSAPAE